LLAGRGPTFVDDFEPYADHYFLRAGDPVEPADLRTQPLPLGDGTLLNVPAMADLDSFSLQTLLPYRSIVTTSSPAQSRPSSLYHLVWAGRYYELWQRTAHPATRVIAHFPYGDSTTNPYCGNAEAVGGSVTAGRPVCSVEPVGTASCTQVRSIAAFAASHHATLVAAERPPNVYVRGSEIPDLPVGWGLAPDAQSIAALTPGQVSVQLKVDTTQRYELWLGGSFGRGFEVSLDGHRVGRVENDLAMILEGAPVADIELAPGIHTITLTHPGASLAPGSGDDVPKSIYSSLHTTLTAIILAPLVPAAGDLVTFSPQRATGLCGKSVDWIEVVGPSA
jgi:hypothetical protein